MSKLLKSTLPFIFALLVVACDTVTIAVTDEVAVEPQAKGPSVEEAVTFVAKAEEHLAALGQHSERMSWVMANFITQDTEQLAAKASEQFTAAQVEIAVQAAHFTELDGLD